MGELKDEKKGGQGIDKQEEGGKEGKGEGGKEGKGEGEEEERGLGTEELEAREDRDRMDVLDKETVTGIFTHMYVHVHVHAVLYMYTVPCLYVL